MWSAEHHGTSMLLVVLSNRRYATLNEAAGRLAGGALDSFTIEPPVIDFSGLAKLYDWRYARASTEKELEGFSGQDAGQSQSQHPARTQARPGGEAGHRVPAFLTASTRPAFLPKARRS